MIVLRARQFLLWSEKTIYFPSAEIVPELVTEPGFAEIVRVSQAPVPAPASPFILRGHPVKTTCLDLTLGADTLYRGMDAKSCRYRIRRAERIKDQIEIRRNGRDVNSDFLELHNRFVVQKGYAKPLPDWQIEIWAQASDIFVIYQDGRPVCAHLMLCDRDAGRTRLMFSVSRRLDNSEDAALSGILNRYLHWYEIQRYCEEGMRVYDFGGIEDGSTPIAKFKLSFGGPERIEYSFVVGGRLTRAAHAVYRVAMPWYSRSGRNRRLA